MHLFHSCSLRYYFSSVLRLSAAYIIYTFRQESFFGVIFHKYAEQSMFDLHKVILISI
ncbi:MAG: hypothetical protein E7494_09040 [Ruminococcus albus]|nr:hypothetical protein [Ruminococcus albus]